VIKKNFSRREIFGLAGKVALAGVFIPRLGFGADNRTSPNPRGVLVGEGSGAEVAAEIFRQGGNAIDAIVAGTFAAFISSPSKCGPGGYGGAMMIALAGNKKVTCIDFNSAAPLAARADMFVDAQGRVKGKTNSIGWRACRERWLVCNWRWIATARNQLVNYFNQPSSAPAK